MDQKPLPFLQQLKGTVLASLSAGLFYHPLETLNKRWQNSELTLKQARCHPNVFKQVIFQYAHNQNYLSKIGSLYQGFSLGLTYKFTQMMYLILGEHTITSSIKNSCFNPYYQQIFGKKHAGTAIHATSGALIGAGECILLPLETLKVQYMTNSDIREKVEKIGRLNYLKMESPHLFKTTSLSMFKNTLGFSAFFGVNAFIKSQYNNPPPSKIIFASAVAATACIVATNPLDVIKVRTQTVEGSASAKDAFLKLLKNEKPSAFFKGLCPKLAIKGTKLTLAYGAAEILANRFKS